MPPETQSPYVTLKKGKDVYDFPRANLAKAKALGWLEVPSDGKKKIQTENGAIDEDSYIENFRASMGFAPKGGLKSDIQDLKTGLKQLYEHPGSSAKLLGSSMLEAQKGVSERALKDIESPDYLTKARGLVREVYAGIPLIGPILERAGTQFGEGHFKGGLGTMTPLLAGQVFGAPAVREPLVSAAEAATEAPGDVVRSMIRSGSAGPTAVKTAERAAAQEQSLYEFNANQARVAARAAHEAGEAEKAARYEEAARKWQTAAEQEKAKARGQYEAERAGRAKELRGIRAKHQGEVAESQKVSEENAKIESAQKTLTEQAQTNTKELTQNLQQTLDNTKRSFDAEYGDFDAKILGKSPENPKGTLRVQLTPLADAVKNAQGNIIEGTPESIKQFQSILSQNSKDFVDLGAGELGVVPGQMISAADLRGYVTELESRLYDSNMLPDVKAAVKSVVDAGKSELNSAIKDVHGQTAVDALKDLNSRYSDYLTDWRDTSSTNPLPRVRRILLEGVVRNNPEYPVHLDIGRILKGSNAQKAAALLNKYKKFGANPEALTAYQKTLEQLDALPKPKKVPEVKAPKYPEPITSTKYKGVKPPEKPEPTPMAKIDYPPRPQVFDPRQFIREQVLKRMNNVGNIGIGMALFSTLTDLVHGRIGPPAQRFALASVAKNILTSEKFLDWVAKEQKKAASGQYPGPIGPNTKVQWPRGLEENPPRTPPAAPPAMSPERAGAKSGINPQEPEDLLSRVLKAMSDPTQRKSGGETLAEEIRKVRAGPQSKITEGEVWREIIERGIRDPEWYKRFSDADERTRNTMIIEIKNMLEDKMEKGGNE